MNRICFHQVYVSVQTRTRIPTALLRLVLQIHIYIHAVPGNQFRQYIAIERIIPVWPINDLLAVHIHIRVTHRSIKNQRVELILLHRHTCPVVPFTHPRQSSATSGLPTRLSLAVLHNYHFLQIVRTIKRTTDGPVVRNRHILPNGVARCVVGELPFAQ